MNNNYKQNIEQNLQYIKHRNNKIRLIKSYSKSILSILLPSLILFITFNFFLGISVVKGESMAFNFHNNDIILFNRLDKNIDRKDIIVAKKENNVKIIKRVIGIPGDSIDIQNNTVYLNGEKLNEENYTLNSITKKQDLTLPVTLNNDEYFILGDNREKSLDSRNSSTGIIHKKI